MKALGFFRFAPLVFAKKFVLSRLRLLWSRLYIRKDEFHRSLDLDIDAYATMSKKKRDKYLTDLTRRRSIAHRKEMGLA